MQKLSPALTTRLLFALCAALACDSGDSGDADSTSSESETTGGSCEMPTECELVEAGFTPCGGDVADGHVEIPVSCLVPLSCDAYQMQAELSGGEACCTVNADDVCVCDSSAPMMQLGDFSGAYTVAGTTLTIEGGASEYCVEGDVLRIRTVDADDGESAQQMRRI